jgi:hypothetical protein
MERDVLRWIWQQMLDKVDIEKPQIVFNADTGEDEVWFNYRSKQYYVTMRQV